MRFCFDSRKEEEFRDAVLLYSLGSESCFRANFSGSKLAELSSEIATSVCHRRLRKVPVEGSRTVTVQQS